MDFFSTQTSRVVAKALDGTFERQTAIVSNIANAQTPGFKAMRVAFEGSLKQAIQAENDTQQSDDSASSSENFLPAGSLKTTNPMHFPLNPVALSLDQAHTSVEQVDVNYRTDENGVDIEHEMAELSKNSSRFAALGKIESKQFSGLNAIIKGAT